MMSHMRQGIASNDNELTSASKYPIWKQGICRVKTANQTKEKGKNMPDKVYVNLHESFVREGIEYVDKETGETKTFNSATLPKGTVVGEKDVGGYQFSPLFVNKSRFMGENWRDIPLLADREVRLTRTVLDYEGNPVRDAQGAMRKDIVKAMPQEIKEAVERQRDAYIKLKNVDRETTGATNDERPALGSVIANAKTASEADGSNKLGAERRSKSQEK